MRSRRTKRAGRGLKAVESDKTLNPLVAATNCPGKGKSAFLVHFPESADYLKYVKEYFGDAKPIVSVITFNNGMSSNSKGTGQLGLRVLYSAARGLGPAGDWRSFLRMFSAYGNLDLQTSIAILRRVLGDRPVLILIDELSKAGSDATQNAIVSSIGSVLDEDGRTDIVVSALSPEYIENLITS